MTFVELQCGLCGCDMRIPLGHYNRRIKNNAPGTPLCCSRNHHIELLRARMKATEAERFWAKVDKSPGHGPKGDCWPWMGSRRSGYGLVTADRITMGAHRRALELATGKDLPEDVDACHFCDYPPCCRPDHLFPGTHIDNMRDMKNKGRRAVLRGSEIGTAKLNEEAVTEIRGLYAFGNLSQDALALRFGVTQVTVGKIVRRESWRHA